MTLDEVYDVLVEDAGASESERLNFKLGTIRQRQICSEHGYPLEWRFSGALGWGGKYKEDGRAYVCCYSEDMTDERRAIIETVNAKLAAGVEHAAA